MPVEKSFSYWQAVTCGHSLVPLIRATHIQDFFLRRANVDVCNGCMRVSVHSLAFVDFHEILDIFKDKNVRFSCNTLSQ